MKHYLPEELDIKNDSESEQIRTRKIFDDLKEKALNGKVLMEREKEFLCRSLNHTIHESDGKPVDFDFCNDYVFKELYLTYFHNNLAGPFHKAKKEKIVEVSQREQIKDFKTLQSISNNWFKQLEITNHEEEVLQELAIETRKDLKELDQKYPRLIRKFRAKQAKYRLQKDKIILQSKFLYNLTKSVMQDYDKSEFEIPFSGQIVELTAYSFIHITSRHYAERIKDKPERSFHYKNFYPKELHIDLKPILTEIDKLGLINLNQTDNIIFEFDKVIYQLWIQKRTKPIKGQGNVEFNRVQSFFPIYDEQKLLEINTDYNKRKISNKLELYVKK